MAYRWSVGVGIHWPLYFCRMLIREKVSLNDVDLAALDDVEVCSTDGALLLFVSKEGHKGHTLAQSFRVARNLGADDIEIIKDVVHVLLGFEAERVKRHVGNLVVLVEDDEYLIV